MKLFMELVVVINLNIKQPLKNFHYGNIPLVVNANPQSYGIINVKYKLIQLKLFQ